MFQHVIDEYPTYNKPLSAKYKKSFGYPTFKERVPNIIQHVIDYLQNQDEIKKNYGEEALTEVGNVISKVQNLKTSMQNDKPLEEVHASGIFQSIATAFNKILLVRAAENGGNPVSWFQTEWLLAECYVYFKLFSIFHESKPFENFDPFLKTKIESFLGAKNAIAFVSKFYCEVKQKASLSNAEEKEYFGFFLKCSLWGNKFDLSLSSGNVISVSDDPLEGMHTMDKNILANDTDKVYDLLKGESSVIDIVLDNAGFELFNDLVFADFLMWSGLASKIIFHGKPIPMFVSDVMTADFEMMFQLMEAEVDSKHALANKECWLNHLKTGKWVMKAEMFWAMPYAYNEMAEVDPDLHSELSKGKLVIFKGDLNYRKLVGDIYWEPKTSFQEALRGFAPTNVLALRTIKADTVAGLPESVFENLNKTEPGWMNIGKYAVIQFSQK